MTATERQRRRRDGKRASGRIRAAQERVAASESMMDDGFMDMVRAMAEAARQLKTDAELKQWVFDAGLNDVIDLFEREAWLSLEANPDGVRAALAAQRSRIIQDASAKIRVS